MNNINMNTSSATHRDTETRAVENTNMAVDWGKYSKVKEIFTNSLKDLRNVCEESAENIDIQNIMKILPYILKLQQQKSAVYGRSYCRHGELSIFFNTERKWDRILNIIEKRMEEGNTKSLHTKDSGTPTETFFDTIIDLASYSLLWVGYIVENNPEILDQFISANRLNE